MGHIDCPETSVRNCHCTLRNVPEERRSLRSIYLQCKNVLTGNFYLLKRVSTPGSWSLKRFVIKKVIIQPVSRRCHAHTCKFYVTSFQSICNLYCYSVRISLGSNKSNLWKFDCRIRMGFKG